MSAKSAIQCEVCGGRVRHGDLIVGKKLSGIRRVVCEKRSCRRTWKKHGTQLTTLWAENQTGAQSPLEFMPLVADSTGVRGRDPGRNRGGSR